MFLSLLFSLYFKATEPVRIVVLDTGYKSNSNFKVPFCPGAVHFDATNKNSKPSYNIPTDNMGHGTHVVSIILQYIKDAPLTDEWGSYIENNLKLLKKKDHFDYCFIIVKYLKSMGDYQEKHWLKAEAYIQSLKSPFILNVSGGGKERIEKETLLIKEFLDKGNRVIAAVGNEAKDLSQKENTYYPAMEPGVTAIGAFFLTKTKNNTQELFSISKNKESFYAYPEKFSNYGLKNITWRLGRLYGAGLNDDIVIMQGTSQAAAMHTGILVKSKLRRQNEF